MSKQVIEPYAFQCKTNIEEHNDMVNKINEIVDVVNELDVEEITKDITALESEVSAQGNEIDAINTEIAGLPTKTDVNNGDITAVAIDKTSEGIEIQLTRPAGVLDDSVALPFINTATLIPTSTERAFKIRFTYTDGTQYDTNEFVIPEGGGTDVSVTGVTVEDGTAPNSFKVAIQLSDASTIASNDYEIDIPAQQNTYPTSVSGILSGTTLTLTIGLNNSTNVTGTANLSAFLTKSEANTTYATKTDVSSTYATKTDVSSTYATKTDVSSTYATKTDVSSTYATKTEVTAVDTKVTAIGITSEGNNVSVNGKTATIVKSVSGQVTDGNLEITVNGVASQPIALPASGGGKVLSSTPLTDLVKIYPDLDAVIIVKEFDIEYYISGSINRTTIGKGTVALGGKLGGTILDVLYPDVSYGFIDASDITPIVTIQETTGDLITGLNQITDDNLRNSTYGYRIFE